MGKKLELVPVDDEGRQQATSIRVSACGCCDAVLVLLNDAAGNVFAAGSLPPPVAVQLGIHIMTVASEQASRKLQRSRH